MYRLIIVIVIVIIINIISKLPQSHRTINDRLESPLKVTIESIRILMHV